MTYKSTLVKSGLVTPIIKSFSYFFDAFISLNIGSKIVKYGECAPLNSIGYISELIAKTASLLLSGLSAKIIKLEFVITNSQSQYKISTFCKLITPINEISTENQLIRLKQVV